MVAELSDDDHDTLDRFLYIILHEHKVGRLSLKDAHGVLAEAFSLAANDENGLVDHLKAMIDCKGKYDA